jgi:solute carrier family 39 (zinc transporter), member 1/2/3
MFSNECLGELQYEGVTTSIVMAGLFISFIIEYSGYRLVKWQVAKKSASVEASGPPLSQQSTEIVSIYVMEAGVIFHSLSTVYSRIPFIIVF